MTKPRYRIAVDLPLSLHQELVLQDNPAHYISQVLRLKTGDVLGVFNRTQGEWQARIVELRKKAVVLQVEQRLREPNEQAPQLTVCFAPIKGGRLETIIEKATELGATVLQPVLTQRTIVDKVNLERAEAIAREAAEQCERLEWPEIRPLIKLPALLADWLPHVPLIYGDESGMSLPFPEYLQGDTPSPLAGEGWGEGAFPLKHRPVSRTPLLTSPARGEGFSWGILIGPEGGFTHEEFALLSRLPAAKGVSLGPRILRADTAVITLCALTLAAWGDWDQKPRFAR